MAPSIHKKLALTSPTSGGCSVGIVRSRTRATEFSFLTFMSLGQIYPDVFPFSLIFLCLLQCSITFPRLLNVCFRCLTIFTYFRYWYCHLTDRFYEYMRVCSVTIDVFGIDSRIFWTLRYSSRLHLTDHYYTHTHAHTSVH
jgi:hypothetical protein